MQPGEPTTADHVILMRMPLTEGDERVRPLSNAGRTAALQAARDMYGSGFHPGPVLASNTPAGTETAAIIAAASHIPDSDIHFADDLFGATTDTLEVRIRALAAPYTLVTLVAHEPGVSELVRILSRDPRAATLLPGQWRHLPWPPPY
jgi:phosphohistidine phosphatase SixA